MTTNIMVAGRNSANVALVKEAVNQHDYQVIPVTSMSLALFLAQKNLPELVLCDADLLDGDPLSFLKELQADDELRQIPFMLLTPKALSESDKKRLMSSGAALILPSDISPRELLTTVEPYIEARLARKEERLIETSE
jgi:CheY-like chemotaxis protein